MTFNQWAISYFHLQDTPNEDGLYDPVLIRRTKDAWEASKAEERERIRFAISQSKLITLGEPSDYALAWNKACDEMLTLVNWTGDDK